MAAAGHSDAAPTFDGLVALAHQYRSHSSAACADSLSVALHYLVQHGSVDSGAPSPLQLVECVTGKLDMIQLAASPTGAVSRQYSIPAASSIPLCGVLPALAASSHSSSRQAAAALAVACLHTAATGDSQRATAGALRCVDAALQGDCPQRLAVYNAIRGPSTAAAATPLLQQAWKDGCGWLPWGLGPVGARVVRCILQDAAHVQPGALQWALRRWAAGSGTLATPQQAAHVIGAVACLICVPGVGATLPHVLGVGSSDGSSASASLPLLHSRLCPRAIPNKDAAGKVETTWKSMGLAPPALKQARALLQGLCLKAQ